MLAPAARLGVPACAAHPRLQRRVARQRRQSSRTGTTNRAGNRGGIRVPRCGTRYGGQAGRRVTRRETRSVFEFAAEDFDDAMLAKHGGVQRRVEAVRNDPCAPGFSARTRSMTGSASRVAVCIGRKNAIDVGAAHATLVELLLRRDRRTSPRRRHSAATRQATRARTAGGPCRRFEMSRACTKPIVCLRSMTDPGSPALAD